MKRYIHGTVIDGDKIWRTLGFPTANIYYDNIDIPNSVFQVNVSVEWKTYHGMWVYAAWKKMFEVHIFNFSKDIYGKDIHIYLLQEIRSNKKFDSLKELTEQLRKDEQVIKKAETKVLTFGTFDVFHKGHIYYLENAKKYGTTLSTIIARDTTVKKIKGFIPKNSEDTRKKEVENSWISDTVMLWDLHDPLIPVQEVQPDIICLGYDQKSFPSHLERYIKTHKVDIVRLESHKPEIYKSSKLK